MTHEEKVLQVAAIRNQLFKVILASDRINRHMSEPITTEASCLSCASDAKKIGEWAHDVVERLCVLLNQPTKEELDAAKVEAEEDRRRA